MHTELYNYLVIQTIHCHEAMHFDNVYLAPGFTPRHLKYSQDDY